MKKAAWALVVLALIPALCRAQVGEKPQGWGYGFFAPTALTPGTYSALHIGAGGEGLLYKGLGLGGEVGYLAPTRAMSYGIGIGSVDGSYHFLTGSPGQRVVPFVTGGYSLAFRSGTLNLANYGGGIHYWFSRHVGLRLEVRDHAYLRGSAAHALGFRVGVAFR